MKSLPLSARPRTAAGKGGARQLRLGGLVPAILYGEHTAPVALSVNAREFASVLKKSSSEHVLVDLSVQGSDSGTELALVKDVQHDPITGGVLHVDFLHILPTKKISVTVPVRVRGVADGVKNFGGILQHTMRELEVEALPADIPEVIDVDVSALGIGDAIHVRDISIERVVVVTGPEHTIASVVPPTVVKEAVPVAEGAAAAEGAAGAPEVIGEKKEEEEEAEEVKEKEKEKVKEKKK
ncbi:MAG: 50S ribosomal protein L25 [Candidatus Zixiibacteriota bacterium]